MKAFFVSGAGTDIGKTHVTAALCRTLRARGVAVTAYKPVASGCNGPTDGDAADLLRALGVTPTAEAVAAINPWRYAAPLAPDAAAAREGRTLPYEELVAWSRARADATPRDGWTFIEGVGGALVPLDASHTVGDWFRALGVPALIVSGSYLGAMSHALTAYEALASRGAVAAIVVNETPHATVALDETAATIERFATVPVIALPREARGEAAVIDALLRVLR